MFAKKANMAISRTVRCDYGADHSVRFSRKGTCTIFSLPHFAVGAYGGHCDGLAIKTMVSTLGLRARQAQAAPLEGSGTLRAQQAESSLRQLGRSECWLWLAALLVSVLSAT